MPDRDKWSTQSASQLQQLAHHDIDQFGEVVRQWDLHFSQVERGEIDCCLKQVVNPDFNFIRISMNRIVDQQGGSAANSHSFLSIIDPSGWVEWCGQPVAENSLLYHGPSGNFETLTNHAWCAYITTISDVRLRQVADSLGYPEVVDSLMNGKAIKPGQGGRVGQLRFLQLRYLGSMADPSFTGERLSQYQVLLEQQVCEEIILIVIDSLNLDEKEGFRVRSLVMENAIGYIRNHARDAVSVADVVAASGVSSRTLYRTFREGLGIPPKHYIKAIRLEGVRKQLGGRLDRQSVTDTANEWGFWHMGDFAHDYRKKYGELPSETCKRSACS